MATIDVETTETAEEARANEVLILDMLDRFLRTEVKPHVHALGPPTNTRTRLSRR